MQHLCPANGTCILGDCTSALAQAKRKAGILKLFLSMATCESWSRFFLHSNCFAGMDQLYFETSASTEMGHLFGHIAEKPVLCKHI